MIDSLLNECIKLPKTGQALKEYFAQIELKIFDAVFEGNYDTDNATWYIVMFILFAYSEESPMLIRSADDRAVQENICTHLKVPAKLQDVLLNLALPELRSALNEYLTMFQSDKYKTLIFLIRQKESWQNAIDNDLIVDKDGLIDWRNKAVALTTVEKLSDRITKLQAQLKGNITIVGFEQLKKFKNDKGRNSLKLENSPFYNREN